jgi:NAD+ kinase
MTMPINLVLLRHGESEGNMANDKSAGGDSSMFTPEFRARHSSSWHLTPKGVSQAQKAGEWIRSNMNFIFDRFYASEYARAMETAAHANLPGASWRLEFYLRERDWGQLDISSRSERIGKFASEFTRRKRDGFFWAPPGGESLANVCLREDRVIQTLHRECSDKNVIVVCHGEVMWAFRVRLERMTYLHYRKLDNSKNPGDKIHNCQIIHYTRRDPESGVLSPHLSWMRSICPWNLELCDQNWHQVVRPQFDNEQMLKMAAKY